MFRRPLVPGVMSSPIVQFGVPAWPRLPFHDGGERLVQRAGFVLINQVARGFGHTVAQLVSDHVEITRELDERRPAPSP